MNQTAANRVSDINARLSTSVNTQTSLARVMEHLGIRNAKLLCLVDKDNFGGQLRMYQANGRVFILQVFEGGNGVEIFAPVSASLSLDTTLAKLDEYIFGTI